MMMQDYCKGCGDILGKTGICTKCPPIGGALSVNQILARVKALAGEWEVRWSWTNTPESRAIASHAVQDFKRLQTDIEKSLDEEAEGMWKQQQADDAERKEGDNAEQKADN